MKLQTINELFYSIVERDAERVMLFKETVRWQAVSSKKIYRDVVGIARTLRSWGIGAGDRVAILSENRPEWAYADFAAMLLSAASVPVYPTLTSEQTAYALRDSGARVLFVSSISHLEKVLAIKDETSVEKIVLIECQDAASVVPGTISIKAMMNQ